MRMKLWWLKVEDCFMYDSSISSIHTIYRIFLFKLHRSSDVKTSKYAVTQSTESLLDAIVVTSRLLLWHFERQRTSHYW